MTTVVWRGDQLCADSFVTACDTLLGSTSKGGVIRGIFYGSCGAMSLCQGFNDWVSKGAVGFPPRMQAVDSRAEGFLIHGNRIITHGAEGWDWYTAEYHAIGSGKFLALGALAHGASAYEAVQVAIKHDIYSGGEIRTWTR